MPKKMCDCPPDYCLASDQYDAIPIEECRREQIRIAEGKLRNYLHVIRGDSDKKTQKIAFETCFSS